MKKNPPRGRDVTQLLEVASLAHREELYARGAFALVEAEQALIQQSIYHKPAYNRNWSWDYRVEARIRGGKQPAKQFDWDDMPEGHSPDVDDEPVYFRDASSSALYVEHHEELPASAPCSIKIAPTRRLR